MKDANLQVGQFTQERNLPRLHTTAMSDPTS